MTTILKPGNQRIGMLRGECIICSAVVEVSKRQAKTYVDPLYPTQPKTQFIACPECGHSHLFVQ